MAEFNFMYPDNAYGIPAGALSNYWRKMRQGGATTGTYIPNSVRRAEMEGIMDSLAKQASSAAARREEARRWNAEMSLKQQQFNAEMDENKRKNTIAGIAGLANPLLSYFMMNKFYGGRENAPMIGANGAPQIQWDEQGTAIPTRSDHGYSAGELNALARPQETSWYTPWKNRRVPRRWGENITPAYRAIPAGSGFGRDMGYGEAYNEPSMPATPEIRTPFLEGSTPMNVVGGNFNPRPKQTMRTYNYGMDQNTGSSNDLVKATQSPWFDVAKILGSYWG